MPGLQTSLYICFLLVSDVLVSPVRLVDGEPERPAMFLQVVGAPLGQGRVYARLVDDVPETGNWDRKVSKDQQRGVYTTQTRRI